MVASLPPAVLDEIRRRSQAHTVWLGAYLAGALAALGHTQTDQITVDLEAGTYTLPPDKDAQ